MKPEEKPPIWLLEERWKKRVEDMVEEPKQTRVVAQNAQSGNASCRESDYGKQSGLKHCKTSVAYGPGQGSSLTNGVDSFSENYQFATWDSQFTFTVVDYELPKNNLQLDAWAVKHQSFENLVAIRHRSASRQRTAAEKVPDEKSENVLKNYWMSKETPYQGSTVPEPLSGEEGENVRFVRVEKESRPVLDMDLVYDPLNHDGAETTFNLVLRQHGVRNT
jgi:hypothetical protein